MCIHSTKLVLSDYFDADKILKQDDVLPNLLPVLFNIAFQSVIKKISKQ